MRYALPFFLPLVLAAAPSSSLTLGDPASEAAHAVSAEHTEIVSGRHPEAWIMSVRASAHLGDDLPTVVIDGDTASAWRVSGPPPTPMARGNWIELEASRAIRLDQVSVHWLGSKPYAYKIYDKPFSDLRRLVHEGVSRGQDDEPELIKLPERVHTRAVRIEFAVADNGAEQGIREVRLGDLPFPSAYPPAAYADAPVETVRRPYYVEFERMLAWTVYNPKIPVADGSSARRLLPRADAFDGGHLDFTLAVTPNQANWITLKLWESQPRSMTQRGDLIVVQTLDGDATQNNRTFLPAFVTEQQHTRQEWYGTKPQPGRWSFAHYTLPAEVIGQRSVLRLRLQGVGNVRRDYPMRKPSPPIYSITGGLAPTISE